MDKQRNSPDMINLMVCPGFCVADNKIIRVNDAAGRLFLSPGMAVEDLITRGLAEYRSFQQGCLWLELTLAGKPTGAVVTAMDGFQVFLADDSRELEQLQVLALAAQELRTPLSNIMVCADRIVPEPGNERSADHCSRLHRGTAQLLRIIGNMSDALRYTESCRLETRNITALMQEIVSRTEPLAEAAGISFSYAGPQEDIFTLADEEQLERAFYNLISNALKFTPRGGSLRVALAKSGKQLRLSVEDSGSGISEGILSNIFSRYLRTPSLEDSRFGLGLGLVLVRAAAMNHGGTVLIDQPGQGTRVTMTLAITQRSQGLLHSPGLKVDYAGERDHGLLELSESLPPELYSPRL